MFSGRSQNGAGPVSWRGVTSRAVLRTAAKRDTRTQARVWGAVYPGRESNPERIAPDREYPLEESNLFLELRSLQCFRHTQRVSRSFIEAEGEGVEPSRPCDRTV